MGRKHEIAAVVALASIAAPISACARDAFLRVAALALSGSDRTKLEIVDRKNCVFAIVKDDGWLREKQIFYLNNVREIAIRRVVERHTRYLVIELHGDAVYEQDVMDRGVRDDASALDDEAERMVKRQPDPQRSIDLEGIGGVIRTYQDDYVMTLHADERRARGAWKYIYANGCVAKKDPF